MKMNKKKSNIARKDKKYVWHPFTQMRDWHNEDIVVIENGSGVWLRDSNGRKYIDGVSSLWTNVHGHRNYALDRAINKQLKRIAHSTFLGLTHPAAIELAERLVKITPAGLNKVFYSDSGSEAVEIALKIAFQYWQNKGRKEKKKFVSLKEAYHGDTVGSVSVGGIDLFHKIYKPLLFKTLKAPSPYCYRCRYRNADKCNWECIKQLENVLRKNSNIAALIIEPLIQAAGGMIVAPRGYLKKVRDLCTRYDVLLIADEVATGFGRTGKMFACAHEGVNPDILVLAKGISGGYLPLAATMVTDKIYNSFLAPYKARKAFYHGHTYTANPLCCAVSLANLNLFAQTKLISRLKSKINYLKKRLESFWELKHVGDIRQCGLMVGIELVKDKTTKKPYPYQMKTGVKVILEARKRNVIIRPLGDVIIIMPPLTIKQSELKKLLDVVYESIKKVTEQ